MGYTHYFEQKKDFTIKDWHSFTDFVERLTHYKPTICGHDGYGLPEITNEVVRFNGDAVWHHSCETFEISRVKSKEDSFGFCKTRNLPYDTAVVACLIFLNHLNPKLFKISSDGMMHQWADGLNLCQAVCNLPNVVIPELT